MLSLYRKHRLPISIAGGLFVLILIMILSRCTQNRKLSTPTSVQELDTASLIDQAFARAEITEEKRLLYLAYALYEPESVPARYRSRVGWFGEGVQYELVEIVDSPAKLCSMSPFVQSELPKLVKKTDDDSICN